MTRAPLARALFTRSSGHGAELPDKKFGPISANPMSHKLGFFDLRPSVWSSSDLKAAPHWASGLRGGVILVLLIGLSGRLPAEEVAYLYDG